MEAHEDCTSEEKIGYVLNFYSRSETVHKVTSQYIHWFLVTEIHCFLLHLLKEVSVQACRLLLSHKTGKQNSRQ